MPAPQDFIDYVGLDAHVEEFIKRLAAAVAIPSVSGDPAHRDDVFKMTKLLEMELKALGVDVQSVPLGTQKVGDDELELPHVLLGRIGDDPNKNTILVYGHYDVQPALKEDGWNTDPFELFIDDSGRMFGRGSTDDKGPILGWLNVLQAHKELGLDLPVNLKFCFEGMEESGSVGLDELIASEKDGFFKGVDAMCISDNYWLNTQTPCLTYGLRGIVYYLLTITGPSHDLHSGVFGRMVHEPMTDLFALMSKLVSSDGHILIPGVEDLVTSLTSNELKRYEDIHFSVQDVEEQVGAKIALSDDKVALLMGRMREPSLSLHGIEGDFSGAGEMTVIPAKVTGKFSIRLVPDQTPENVDQLVQDYIHSEFEALGTKCTMNLELTTGAKPWLVDPDHPNYVAAATATKEIYGVEPDLTREGGSIPVTLTFAEQLGVNVLLLPMGRGDDGAHSPNEKLDRSNFINGTKVLGTYLYEVADVDLKV